MIKFLLNPETREKYIHEIFQVSIILKAINGFFEIVGGIFFLFTGTVSSILFFLVKHELLEDPRDFIATHVQALIPTLSAHTQLFGSFYLLSHGIVKIFLVVALLRNKLWAYPVSIGFLGLFIIIQTFQIIHKYSLILLLLTLFDLFLIIIVWHEYKYFKKYHSFPK